MRTPYDGGVQHARPRQIGWVRLRARDDRATVHVVSRGSERLPVAGGRQHVTAAETRGANGRSGLADHRHGLRRGQTRPRPAIVRTQRGIAHHQLDPVERHAQFFREGLGEQRARSLPHVHLARERAVGAVLGDLHAHGHVLPLRTHGDEQEETAAEDLQKVAAIRRERVQQVEDLVALGLELLLEALLVGTPEVVSHDALAPSLHLPRVRPPRSSDRSRTGRCARRARL